MRPVQVDWVGDPDAEAAVQAEDLRRLVHDPSHEQDLGE
jgi:hypothetical protein